MTQRNEFPLRQIGRPWPGVNTRGGVIDDGSGQLTEESTNVTINREDVLAKRKGFVRGMDEYFGGPVCGLFRYTSECGVENLLVASEAGFFIREPFAVPVFEQSDAYPFDSFQTADVNVNTWLNTLPYLQQNGQLQVVAGSDPDPLVWFKQATANSYQERIEYQFDEDSTASQTVTVIIKAGESTATAARLEASLERLADSSSTTLTVKYVDANLNETTLLSSNAGTDATGFMTLSYDAERRVARIFIPNASVDQEFTALSQVQDDDLGQWTAIQIAGSGTNAGIKVVDAGPI